MHCPTRRPLPVSKSLRLCAQQHLVAPAQGYAYQDGCGRVIEAAFSTDAAWRHRGLAELLFAEITDHALATGVGRVVAQCMTTNHPMRAVLRVVATVCENEDGEVLGAVELAVLA